MMQIAKQIKFYANKKAMLTFVMNYIISKFECLIPKYYKSNTFLYRFALIRSEINSSNIHFTITEPSSKITIKKDQPLTTDLKNFHVISY